MRAHLRMKHIRQVSVFLFSFLLIAGFQNCAKQNFTSSASKFGNNDDDSPGIQTQTGGPNCREELRSLTVPVKPIFVVDTSGSNKKDPGSDPDKAVRGGSIQRFFNSYGPKGNFAWTFITFSGSAATTLTSNSNSTGMQSAINLFLNDTDDGNTPYVAALDAAKNAIDADSGRTSGTKYIVVFLSDGLPNPTVSDSTLNSKVGAIVNAAPGQVSFNAVYYGPADAQASGRLQMMAGTGGGNFLNTNTNPTGNAFLISDLVIVPGINCN